MMSKSKNGTSQLVIVDDAEVVLFEHAPTGLILRGNPTYEEWCAEGEHLFSRDNAGRWQFGDWVVIGEQLFGEEHHQANALTHYAPQTISNRNWVCNKIDLSRRRQLPYTYSHHDAVASLTPAMQEFFLDWCKILDDKGKWTGRLRGRDELREAVKLYKHNQERLAAGENLDDPEPEPPAPPSAIAVARIPAKALLELPELELALMDIDESEIVRVEIWKV